MVVDEESGYATSTKLDTASMVDLTDAVVENDGVYTVSYVPEAEGDYLMLAFWQYGTAENV